MTSLQAVLRCGADAVYGGFRLFSARGAAENFDEETLPKAVALCHLYGAKFYLALNTLVADDEWEQLTDLLRLAAGIGIDGVLVQDAGVLDTIQKCVPDLPIHASTQMSIHSKNGVLWARRHKIKRVVLARELSREEIRPLLPQGIEIEQFVHGALCMSLSGQCTMSAAIGTRSANRGNCAGACRLPFSANGQEYYALSLRDLCLVPYAKQMAQDGVAALKIEGRRKRPAYAAAAVTALRETLAGKKADLKTLKDVFSRSGFTDGYYTGRRRDMFGVRRKEDVEKTRRVLPKLEELYRRVPQFVDVWMTAKCTMNTPISLELKDAAGNRAAVFGDVPEKAKQNATDDAQIEKQLRKLGGTIFRLKNWTAVCDGVSYASAACWNRLRRAGVKALAQARVKTNTPRYETHFEKGVPAAETVSLKKMPSWRVWLAHYDEIVSAILETGEKTVVLLPIQADLSHIADNEKSRIFLTLPKFCPDDELLEEYLKQAIDTGFSHVVCENVGHLEAGRRFGFFLHGGAGLNIYNRRAALFYQKEGLLDSLCSPEMTISQIRALLDLPVGVYGYGNMDLMTVRLCPIKAQVGCKNCRNRLLDRTGRVFPVYCNRTFGYATVFNTVPVWTADKGADFAGVDYVLLDCRLAKKPLDIFYAHQNGAAPKGAFTRGLFYRGVK